MEAVFEPRPGVVGGLVGRDAIKLRQFVLGGDGGEIEKRMLIFDAAQHTFRRDAIVAV